MAVDVIAIFDIGKTNKKLVLLNEHYHIVFEKSTVLPEITDEDDFPCGDVAALTQWIIKSLEEVLLLPGFSLKAINFSGHGASFVFLDQDLRVIPPLYNYLKPLPEAIRHEFYGRYGGERSLSLQTASPVLGNLNSGMQLYRLKIQHPEKFEHIRYALHLPEYLSFILTQNPVTGMTSLGCHTLLWNFETSDYHGWVKKEGLLPKFAPITGGETLAGYWKTIPVGPGLHDSSSALLPYRESFKDPFILISTGTWCISLNPFNATPLTAGELRQDCLCYLTPEGTTVKASRLMAGYQHETEARAMAEHFGVAEDRYVTVPFNGRMADRLMRGSGTSTKSWREFPVYDDAYHQLIFDIVQQQVASTQLVMKGSQVKRIFVDGGFGKNAVFMNFLALLFTGIEISAASVPMASALGAALIMHRHWNRLPLPERFVELTPYPAL